MSVRALTWVFGLEDQPRLGARLVLLALADNANDDTLEAWPSVETIARKACLSKRQVQYALRDLEGRGFVMPVAKSAKGTTTYELLIHRHGGADFAPAQSTTPGGAIHDTEGAQPTAPEPSCEPSIRTEQDEVVDGVWAYWLGAHQPKVTKLAAGTRRLLARALNVGFDAQDLCLAIDGLLASDWHREHGKLQLSTIFTTGPGTQSFEDRIQSFIDKAPGASSRQPNGHRKLPDHVRAALIAARNHATARWDAQTKLWLTDNETINAAAREATQFALERYGLDAAWTGEDRRTLEFRQVTR